MGDFMENLICDVILIGFYQVIFAILFAGPVLLVCMRFFHANGPRVLRRYALFHLFLLGWGVAGNAAWLQLTAGRLAVRDDAPVWASFIPFGRFMLYNATGFAGGWELRGGTTMGQLQGLWAATAVPVWILAGVCMYIYLRLRGATGGECVQPSTPLNEHL